MLNAIQKGTYVIACLVALIGLATLVSGVVLFYTAPVGNARSHSYTGQEVFYDEAEYAAFKQAIDEAGIDIGQPGDKWGNQVNVLSSAPPIIVNFRFYSLPMDTAFPYGQEWVHHKYSAQKQLGSGLIPSGAIVMLSALGLLALGEHLCQKRVEKHA